MKGKDSEPINQEKEDLYDLDKNMKYVCDAEDRLLEKLFGFVPEVPGDYSVSRKAYVKAMKEVQKEFQLVEGNPRLVLFVLEQLYRSPRIIDHTKINKKRSMR